MRPRLSRGGCVISWLRRPSRSWSGEGVKKRSDMRKIVWMGDCKPDSLAPPTSRIDPCYQSICSDIARAIDLSCRVEYSYLIHGRIPSEYETCPKTVTHVSPGGVCLPTAYLPFVHPSTPFCVYKHTFYLSGLFLGYLLSDLHPAISLHHVLHFFLRKS